MPERYQKGYYTGPSFISQINFLGCAPNIQLIPDEHSVDGEFCAIRFHCHDSSVFLHVVSQLPMPRCPDCRARFSSLPDISIPDIAVPCQKCQRYTPVHSLVWRQMAGYARFFVEVTGVYPHEALPTPGLLKTLTKLSHCDWHYFYR